MDDKPALVATLINYLEQFPLQKQNTTSALGAGSPYYFLLLVVVLEALTTSRNVVWTRELSVTLAMGKTPVFRVSVLPGARTLYSPCPTSPAHCPLPETQGTLFLSTAPFCTGHLKIKAKQNKTISLRCEPPVQKVKVGLSPAGAAPPSERRGGAGLWGTAPGHVTRARPIPAAPRRAPTRAWEALLAQ